MIDTIPPPNWIFKFVFRPPWIGSVLRCPKRFEGEHRGEFGKGLHYITYPLKPNVNQKVRARYDATPTLSETLESLVENEKGEKKRTATEGLLWLLRGLSFTCKALQNAQNNKAEELAAAFTKSYDGTLKKFHNFVVKGIFSVSCDTSIQ
jgi:hypothetical protein